MRKEPLMKYRPKARYWICGADVDLDAVRKDMADLYERGFGSVEVVSFTAFGDSNAPMDLRWGSEAWIEVLKTILEEAKRLNMTVDLANGPAWPIAMPSIKSADDPAALYELTYGKAAVNDLDDMSVPKPRVVHEEGKVRLIACMLYEEISPMVLDQNSFVDLMPYIHQGKITYNMQNVKGHCQIFAFYAQPACQKVADNYVIDHLSEAGIQACQEYWLPLYEKHLKPYKGTLKSLFCDSLEYKVSMEWTRDFIDYFKQLKGYDLCPYLPVISSDLTYPKNDICGYCFNDEALTKQVQYDYFDVITSCYVHRHLEPMEKMANQMDMNVRYQVAYNKPFEIEKAAGAVGICEGEALNRVSLDNLKSMAGTVHLLGKPKYSYECSAEFGNGYGQTFEDIFWWMKRAYSAGMNDQVFHGVTYNGKRKQGYYEPFGKEISNYWNRVLDVKGMRYHLSAFARLNQILQEKKHYIDIAVYRHDYINNGKGGDGDHLLKDQLLLTKQGYTYDFVSLSTLPLLKDHHTNYKALIIEARTYLTKEALRIIQTIDLPVVIVGNIEKCHPLYECAAHVLNYEKLLAYFKKQDIKPYVQYHQPTLIFNQCLGDCYYFYNGNAVSFGYNNGKKIVFDPATIYPTINKAEAFEERMLDVSVAGTGYPVIMDYKQGDDYKIPYTVENDRYHIRLKMKKDEALLIGFVNEKEYQKLEEDICHTQQAAKETVLNDWTVQPYQICLEEENDYFQIDQFEKMPQTKQMTFDELAGYIDYTTELTLSDQGNYALSFQEIVDTFEVTVDGKTIKGFSQYEPWVWLGELSAKKHQLKIRVYTPLRPMLRAKMTCGIIGEVRLSEYKI